MNFIFLIGWKKSKEIIFYDKWKWYDIEISVSKIKCHQNPETPLFLTDSSFCSTKCQGNTEFYDGTEYSCYRSQRLHNLQSCKYFPVVICRKKNADPSSWLWAPGRNRPTSTPPTLYLTSCFSVYRHSFYNLLPFWKNLLLYFWTRLRIGALMRL